MRDAFRRSESTSATPLARERMRSATVRLCT